LRSGSKEYRERATYIDDALRVRAVNLLLQSQQHRHGQRLRRTSRSTEQLQARPETAALLQKSCFLHKQKSNVVRNFYYHS
jgi:hypothetical protein